MKLKLDYKKCHEGLWGWLAKNPDKEKEDWPGFKTIDKFNLDIPFHLCFACEIGFKYDCICPVDFGVEDGFIVCKNDQNSYYYKWLITHGQERSQYAKLIANGWK